MQMQALCLHITWRTVWWFTILQTEETDNLASSHHLISWQHESALCCDTTGERRLAWKSQIWWMPKYEPRSTTGRADSREHLWGSWSAHKVTSLSPYLYVLSSTLIYSTSALYQYMYFVCVTACVQIWCIPTTSACLSWNWGWKLLGSMWYSCRWQGQEQASRGPANRQSTTDRAPSLHRGQLCLGAATLDAQGSEDRLHCGLWARATTSVLTHTLISAGFLL